MDYHWFIIFLSLLFSAVFNGAETAFISLNRLQVELENKQGLLNGKILSYFVKNSFRFINTMLVGNSIALVLFGIFTADKLHPLLNRFFPLSFFALLTVKVLIITLFVLIAGDFFPKVIFRTNPNKALKLVAVPLLAFYYLLYPAVSLISLFSKILFKYLLKVQIYQNAAFGKIDLDQYIEELSNTEEQTEKSEIEILRNALDFKDVKVRECMIPRTEIAAVEVNDSIADLQDKFRETGFSKIVIYKDTIDDILGFVHMSEMFKKPRSIQSILMPISVATETMSAHNLLNIFKRQHKSIALVVDELGGTSGLVTLEDVMEKIFGEINDEHDTDEQLERVVSESEYVFSARLEIDYLNHKYGFSLPESENYSTIGGFVVYELQDIPDKDEQVFIAPYRIRVLEVTNKTVEKVLLKVES